MSWERGVVVVTMVNRAYARMGFGALLSVRMAGYGGMLGVVVDGDVGMEWRERYEGLGAVVRPLEEGKRVAGVYPEGWRCLAARPYLPEYFPEAEVIVHVDADAWVQRANALRGYVCGVGRRGGVAVVKQRYLEEVRVPLRRLSETEVECFSIRGGNEEDPVMAAAYVRGWGERPVSGGWVTRNMGVFAAARGDAFWWAWGNELRAALARGKWHFLLEQCAANVALEKLGYVEDMGIYFNYLLDFGLPRVSSTGLLWQADGVEGIGVVHLASLKRFKELPLNPLGEGGAVLTAVHYLDRVARW